MQQNPNLILINTLQLATGDVVANLTALKRRKLYAGAGVYSPKMPSALVKSGVQQWQFQLGFWRSCIGAGTCGARPSYKNAGWTTSF